MTKYDVGNFVDLLRPRKGETPAQTQRRAMLEFRTVAEHHGFELTPGPINSLKGQLVIGVASYSVADLALLDRIAGTTHKKRPARPRIAVVDIAEFESPEAFQTVFAQVPLAAPTPIVIGAVRGKGQASGLWGIEAKEFLEGLVAM